VQFGDVVRDVKVTVDPETSGLERYVAGEHMNTDDLHIRRWGTVGDGYLGPAFHRKFAKGQVLYGSRRTYLRKVAVAEFDGICANTTFVLEPKGKDLLPELLPFIMQTESFSTHSVKQSRGSVNPYVNFKDIAWYEFALPPKDEQHRIAEILWTTDKAVSKIVEAQTHATKVYELVSDELLTKGIGSKKLVDTVVGKLPQDWELKPLNNLVSEDAPIRYGIVQVGEHIHDGIPTLAIKDLFGDYRNNVHRTSKNREEKYIGSRVRPNDVLLSIKATVGRVEVVPEWFEGNISRDLARIRVNDEVHPWFLLYLLRSPNYQRYMDRYVVGSTRKELSIHALRKLLIPVPPFDEQQKIVRALNATQKSIKDSQSHYTQLMNLKRQLLMQLLPTTN
jgi:type I restriction enzyme S subunit